MTPPRKRQVRLVVSLTLAVLLASGLIGLGLIRRNRYFLMLE